MAKRKAKKELDETITKIKDIELSTPKEEGSSPSVHTEDSESDSTVSETEDKVFKLPTRNRHKEKEKKEQGYYELLMKLKRIRFPGWVVCPEAECEVKHNREEKMAKHILSHHSNTTHAKKAKEDILRIGEEKKDKRKDQENNKKEREKKSEEARKKKELEDFQKVANKMEEETAELAELRRRAKINKQKKKKKKGKGSDSSDSSSSSESDEDEKKKRKKKKKKEKESSSSESDNEKGKTCPGGKNKPTIVPLKLDWNNYIKPKCLDEENELMDYFVKKQALTRGDIPNPNRAYGDMRFKPMRNQLVAPLFEKKICGDLQRLRNREHSNRRTGGLVPGVARSKKGWRMGK